jgi:DNA-binding transcriptional LysR family regulator
LHGEDAPLFERSRLGVRSTPLGDMLAREGRAIASRLKEAAEVSARHRTGLRSTVRLGAGPMIGAGLLPGLARQLLHDHPNIHLALESDRPNLLVDQLVDGRYDLVIAPSWLDRPPPGVERFLLAEDDLGVFCGSTHPLASSGALAGASAKGCSWISLGTASPFDQDVREMLKEAGVTTPRAEISVLGGAFILLSTLAQGAHLAVLPHFPMRLLSPHFPLVELALTAQRKPRNIYLWCRTMLLQDPTVVAIKDAILEYAKHV